MPAETGVWEKADGTRPTSRWAEADSDRKRIADFAPNYDVRLDYRGGLYHVEWRKARNG